jgi:hypothetical protein
MPITEVFAFLVHPQKGEEQVSVSSGVTVPLSGDLFSHLSEVYKKSLNECEIEVVLTPSGDGTVQHSHVRDVLLEFAGSGSLDSATTFATRLAGCTTRRSGLGLLFVIRATENSKTTILLSRFPTETAILVDDGEGGLNVKFLDKVFVKTYYTYKAALFTGVVAKGEFWEGSVLDKQINLGRDEASQYWVKGFLEAEFKVTSHHGTTRLARALVDASAGASFDAKRELHHLAAIAENLEGKSTSISKFIEKFSVGDEVADRIRANVKTSALDEVFVFSRPAYNSVIAYRTVETAEGAILTALSADFETIFSYETVGHEGTREKVRLSTVGLLATDKLRRSK